MLGNRAGIPLADTQAELTPFQRLVLQKEMERQQREAESQGGHGTGGGTPQIKNSKAQPGGGTGSMGGAMQGETVEYVNEGK